MSEAIESNKSTNMKLRNFFRHPHVKTALNLAFVFMFGFAVATLYITRTNRINIQGTIQRTENGALIINARLITGVDLGENLQGWWIEIDGVALNIHMI